MEKVEVLSFPIAFGLTERPATEKSKAKTQSQSGPVVNPGPYEGDASSL